MTITPSDYNATDDTGRAAIEALCHMGGLVPWTVTGIDVDDGSVTFSTIDRTSKTRDVVVVEYRSVP